MTFFFLCRDSGGKRGPLDLFQVDIAFLRPKAAARHRETIAAMPCRTIQLGCRKVIHR